MNALVIPTNRPERLAEFFKAWQGKGGWDTVIIVEDSPNCSDVSSIALGRHEHYCWADIDRILGGDAGIISRQDSAIRCFGFLAAYHLGADYVLTLDDDCYPMDFNAKGDRNFGAFFPLHISYMKSHTKWVQSCGQRSRGLPYRNHGTLKSDVNVGLWTGSGDPDAIENLLHPVSNFQPPSDNWLVPANQYVPLCAMSLCLTQRALPLFYFPPMGKGQPYRRFDDIWAGIIAKKILDRLGWNMGVGEPFIEHRRQSNPFKNLTDEAPGIAANEWFWQVIDGVELQSNTPLALVNELGAKLRGHQQQYVSDLGSALMTWIALFNPSITERFVAND